MIYDNMDLLGATMNEQLAYGGTTEMRKNFLAMTTDTLCGHTFNESFNLNLLKSEQMATDWQRTIKAVATLTPLVKQFPWIIPVALKCPLGLLQVMVPDLARIVGLRRVGNPSP